MDCINCKSNRIAEVNAKCSDLFQWDSGECQHNGYVNTPDNELGSGDYIEFKYCLECGQIQHKFPVPSKHEEDIEKEDNEETIMGPAELLKFIRNSYKKE